MNYTTYLDSFLGTKGSGSQFVLGTDHLPSLRQRGSSNMTIAKIIPVVQPSVGKTQLPNWVGEFVHYNETAFLMSTYLTEISEDLAL